MKLSLKEALTVHGVQRARHDSGPRSRAAIKWVVLHSTEGGTAASVASFFAGNAQASTQLVVDDKECWRMVPDLVIPWGAPGVNTGGLHVEQCGYARYTTAQWLAHEHTLQRSAAQAAQWAHEYGIPLRVVKKWGLKLGRKGVTTHSEASRAFTPGGHTDPGPGFPIGTWMAWAKAYLAEIEGHSVAPTDSRWKWARWWLGEGEYKHLGPRKGVRPSFKPGPKDWAWLKTFVANRKKGGVK
jgi:hypothetical protein